MECKKGVCDILPCQAHERKLSSWVAMQPVRYIVDLSLDTDPQVLLLVVSRKLLAADARHHCLLLLLLLVAAADLVLSIISLSLDLLIASMRDS
jgi:hypothetical protein